jgi:hypothetical protein
MLTIDPAYRRQAIESRVRSAREFKVLTAAPSRTPSLHALLLRLPIRRLVLELHPFPSRIVILPMNHVRVNLLGGS